MTVDQHPGMSLKEIRRWMQADAKRFGAKFVDLPTEGTRQPPRFIKAMRNRQFMVQVYEPEEHQAEHVLVRLSINYAILNDSGGWVDGITWDQLYAIKAAVGYGKHDAVEIYPGAAPLVNVANIRHLWVMRNPLPYAWREGD